jgi:hypothetical protein
MEEFADKERRKLGNVGEVLLEWRGNSYKQQAAWTAF